MPHHPSINVSQAVQSLAASGNLSQAVADQLGQDDRTVSLPSIARGFAPPVMSCILIDASPSMKPCQGAVIEGHKIILDAWRGSSNCRKNALYVAQYLFSTAAELLNPFAQLAADRKDSVAVLNSANYDPESGDGTALYQTVYQLLQDMAANIAFALGKQIKTTFTIMVITDGEDNRGGIDPNDIRMAIQDLKLRKHLTRSTVIGITHPKFSAAMVNAIKDTLGFDEAILCSQDSAEIRRACDQASKSAMQARV